jgi:uncharacterized membrane protein YraQ (UPF0718 family)
MSNVSEIGGSEMEMRAVRHPVMGARISAFFGDLLQRIDWVVVAIVVIPISVAAIDPVQLGPLLLRTRDAVEKTAPFMLMAIAIAGAVRAAGAENLIARAARQREGRMVALFAIAGALLPFCSCGVVPVIASLLAAGVPVAPVMAFWMSAPLMDPSQFFITAGELGWQFAIARAAAAVGLGLFGGYATMAFMHSIGFANPIRFKIKITGPNKYAPDSAATVHWRFWNDRERLRVFAIYCAKTFWFLFRWLLLAFLLAKLMMAYLPPATVASLLSRSGGAEIPIAGALGAVLYVNSFAAIPLVSGLIALGLSKAAGLTFIVAGGLTSIPAMTAVWVLVTRKVFFWHLSLALIGSLLAGYAYAAFLAVMNP